MSGAENWVRYVGEVLGRSQALFADDPATAPVGAGLSTAGAAVRAGTRQIAGGSGRFVQELTDWGARTAPALDRLAGLDQQLDRHLGGAVGATRAGHRSSGAVRTAAAADTAALGPVAGTPTGERMLLQQLRARLAQQQRIIAAYRVRDARMAAALRSMLYQGSGGSGYGAVAPPLPVERAMGGPAGSRGGAAWSAPVQGAQRTPRRGAAAVSAPTDDRWSDPALQLAGAGGAAVTAALSRRGCPYVWGAKGPSNFDCSGLTQWAWRQAGVQLGGDTYSQIGEGVPVPMGQVRAGDLIFPTSSFDGRGPGHVQLAISATEVVHAPHTGDVVRVAPLPSSYVARRPVREL